jgi:hypothetical protein
VIGAAGVPGRLRPPYAGRNVSHPTPPVGASSGARVRDHVVDGKAGTTFTVVAVAALPGGSVGRLVIVRFLIRLRAEGRLGEAATPVRNGGPISVCTPG